MGTPAHELLNSEALASSLPSRFEVVKTLGSGASGLVLLANDKLLGREVTIKILRSAELAGEAEHKRFIREAKLLATIDHPNIVKILASDITTNGYPYHVMEYLNGEPLSDKLKGEPLPLDQFCEIMMQVCAGLECAHSAGIIHRDLKPSNIFICKEIDNKIPVKVIDFGMSKAEDASPEANVTRTNAVIGSPTYMSPEQCKGKNATIASDIYSLGCIMYECATGAAPFQAETAYEVMYKHINEEAKSLTLNSKHEAAQSLGKLIDSCLEKDPTQRPTDLKAINADLAQIAKIEIKSQDLFQKKREHTAIFVLVAFLAVLLTLGAVNLYMTHTKSVAEADKLEKEMAAAQDHHLDQIRALIEIQKRRVENSENLEERGKNGFQLMESYKKLYDQIKRYKNWNSVEGLKYFRTHPDDKNYLATKAKALEVLDEAYLYCKKHSPSVKMREQLLRRKADTLIELDRLDEAMSYCDRALKEGGDIRTLEESEVLSTRSLIGVLKRDYDQALEDIDKVGTSFATIAAGKQEDSRYRKQAARHGVLLSPDRRGEVLANTALAVKLAPPKTVEEKKKAAKICAEVIKAWAERAQPDPSACTRILQIAEDSLADVPSSQQGNVPKEIQQLRKQFVL